MKSEKGITLIEWLIIIAIIGIFILVIVPNTIRFLDRASTNTTENKTETGITK